MLHLTSLVRLNLGWTLTSLSASKGVNTGGVCAIHLLQHQVSTAASKGTLSLGMRLELWLGDPDAFLAMKKVEANTTSSTMCPESCAGAGVQLFRHTARCSGHSFHLKHLQLCTRGLPGTDFTHVL